MRQNQYKQLMKAGAQHVKTDRTSHNNQSDIMHRHNDRRKFLLVYCTWHFHYEYRTVNTFREQYVRGTVSVVSF